MTTQTVTHWQGTELTISCCATLAGCTVNSGMVNCFNKMEQNREFVDCQTIGDYYKKWLQYLIDGKDVYKD